MLQHATFSHPPLLVSPKFLHVPLGLGATKSEDVGLIFRAISFQDFQSMGHDPPTLQTDGQTTCDSRTARFAL